MNWSDIERILNEMENELILTKEELDMIAFFRKMADKQICRKT